MLMTELLFAVLVAGIMTVVFAGGFRRPGPWASGLWFFLVVLLAGWVAGAWATPVGPPLWGAYWVPILWFGLLIALLLAAAAPPRERPQDALESVQAGNRACATVATVALSWFFWALLIGLAVAICVRYFARAGT